MRAAADDSRGSVAVIGGGPAGLMAAEVIATGGARVTIYDAMPSVGRKLLMAGRSGLNLTHSEPFEAFLARYGVAASRLEAAIRAFTPSMLRAWCEELGQPTFVGSSGRVFPKAMKASPLLRAWLRRLDALGVTFQTRHRWRGWDAEGGLIFDGPVGEDCVRADAVVLALGGASWPRLGSDGGWIAILAAKGVGVTALEPANCGFVADWSDLFRTRFEGHPLKNASFSCGEARVRGEAVITSQGIEGGAIYALSAALREELRRSGAATLLVNLRPDEATESIAGKLRQRRKGQSLATLLRKALSLSPVAIGLIHEAAHRDGRSLAAPTAEELARLVAAVPVKLTAPAPLARAISTAGGVRFGEINESFMLRRLPGVFVAGEMLDWDAPTGGYLLQACFATGAAAGRGALAYLSR